MSGFHLARPTHFLALGFGTGLLPRAPGTFGTLAGLPLYGAMSLAPLSVYVGGTLALLVVGVWLCGRVSGDVGGHDHPAIVWDEIVGFLVAGLPLAAGASGVHPLLDLALVFGLFRLFDSVKVGPVRWLDERFSGGAAIMADDVAAGVAAAAAWWLLVALGGVAA